MNTYIYIYIYKYITYLALNKNDSTKLVISVRAGGKPPAREDHQFCTHFFWASYVIYFYIYSTAPRIPPGQVDGWFCVAPGQVLGSLGWGWEGPWEIRDS